MDSGNNNIKSVSKGLCSFFKRHFETKFLDWVKKKLSPPVWDDNTNVPYL